MADRIKIILDLIQDMSGGYSQYEVFTDWVLCSAIAIQNACCMIEDKNFKKREMEYLQVCEEVDRNHVREAMI